MELSQENEFEVDEFSLDFSYENELCVLLDWIGLDQWFSWQRNKNNTDIILEVIFLFLKQLTDWLAALIM